MRERISTLRVAQRFADWYVALIMNHPYYPSVSQQGRVNSGITALDHAALEILKTIVPDYDPSEAAQCAEDAFVFAIEYMRVKESYQR